MAPARTRKSRRTRASYMPKKNSPGTKGRGWDLPDIALSHALREFLDSCGARGLSPRTLRQRSRATRRFILWCQERGLTKPAEITLPILERYQRHLFHYRKSSGEPLTFGSQYAELAPLKAYFKWLTRSRYILHNPAAELELPKVQPRLSRYVLTVADVEAILNAADPATLLGLRDRTLMELLYSSAIRRAELIALSVFDVDTRRGTVFVRAGKGAKDRLVPLGERACAWVDRYVNEARPELVHGHDHHTLFLTVHGDRFDDYTIGETVKRYIAKAGITVAGACHLFRHACATHMLENGADTRFIQAMLGHSLLSTTQIYTHVAVAKLKEIHTATHPARLTRSSATPARQDRPDASALLSSLAAEAAAEDQART
jgi:integrase/recombinase XerD